MKAPLMLLTAMLLAGCADTNWSRNVYEGVRQQRQVSPDPSAPPPTPAPDYEQYKRERETLKSTPMP